MASTYSDLKIELIGTGEQTGTWGATTNTNLSTALGEAITGSADVAFSSADVTVTLTDTNAAQTARNLRLNLTGTSGGARNLILGTGCQIEKLYLINNGLADAVTVKNTTGTGIVVPAGSSMFVYNNGTNVVEALKAITVGAGGTGLSTLTANNVILGNGTSAVQFVAPGTAGNVLTSNGTTWISSVSTGGVTSFSAGTTGFTPNTSTTGAITLAGTLVAANGGTGLTSVGTAGNVLTSNGTAWVSSPATGTGATYVRTSFTATGGQTTFTVSYTVGYVEVFLNGVLLNGTDYTASNGTTVVLATGATAGDIVETIAYAVVQLGTATSLAGGIASQIPYQTGANTTAFIANGTSGQVLTSNGTSAPSWTSAGDATTNIGFLNIPQNSQSANYTLVLGDSGEHIFHPSADTTARTWTIPANSSVAFPIGTAVTFINQNSAGVITIAITTDTMRLAGAGTTGNRTLAANGIATAIKIASTEWIISGTGLT